LSYRNLILADNPKAYWRFEGTTQLEAFADETGGGAVPTLQSGTIDLGVTGVHGQAARFNGTDTNLRFSNAEAVAAGLITSGACTIEAWVVWEAQDATWRRIAAMQQSGTFSGWYLAKRGTDQRIFFSAIQAGDLASIICEGPVIIPNKVYHVVGRLTPTEISLFVDGTEIQTQQIKGFVPGDRGFGIGVDPNAGSGSHLGILDEVAYYDYALTNEQIAAHNRYPANRVKTVEYAQFLGTIPNNTLTSLGAMNIHLPEAHKAIRSAILTVSWDDAVSAATNITLREVQVAFDGGSNQQILNLTTTVTNSGENLSLAYQVDFTSLFIANWARDKTDGTLTPSVRINQGVPDHTNVCATLAITYEYDEASASHVKTVYIPLAQITGALPTAEPGTAQDTIPVLNTYLPEAGKTIRQVFLVAQGNTANAAGSTTVTHALGVRVGATLVSSDNIQGALASDRWTRYVRPLSIDTSATHEFRIWTAAASAINRHHNIHLYLVVTYTFDPAATTEVLNSVVLPMEYDAPIDGVNATDFNRAWRDLWIQEPGPITIERSALLVFYHQAATSGNIGCRIGTGAYTLHAAIGSVTCGSLGLMRRAETFLTLGRGRNRLQADIYRTSATNLTGNASALWIINYRSGKHAQGVGAHNHTVFGDVAAITASSLSSVALGSGGAFIPEPDYFLNSVGYRAGTHTNATGNPAGMTIIVQRHLSEPGGATRLVAYSDISEDDPEIGMRYAHATARFLFQRFPGDADPGRINAIRGRVVVAQIANNATSWGTGEIFYTYHTITYQVAGTLTGFDGEEVTIDLIRASDGQRMKRTTRTGDGSYSFSWYDNTEPVYVEVSTPSGKLARTNNLLAQ
jgi:hypothetical protein